MSRRSPWEKIALASLRKLRRLREKAWREWIAEEKNRREQVKR